MDTGIVIALIGLVGVGLGALLSGLGYFLKVRTERMKTKNIVLFHLLEIRHLIKLEYINPNELLEKYLGYCEDYFVRRGLTEHGQVPGELRELIKSHFQNLSDSVKPSMNISFINSFNDAVYSLSKDNPVLAFQLSGRERVNSLVKVQSEYIDSVNNIIIGDEVPDAVKEKIFSHVASLNYDVIEDLINEIDRDIRLVSAKAGILAYFSTKSILKESKKKDVVFDPKEYDPMMDQLISVIVEAANNSSQGAQQNFAP